MNSRSNDDYRPPFLVWPIVILIGLLIAFFSRPGKQGDTRNRSGDQDDTDKPKPALGSESETDRHERRKRVRVEWVVTLGGGTVCSAVALLMALGVLRLSLPFGMLRDSALKLPKSVSSSEPLAEPPALLQQQTPERQNDSNSRGPSDLVAEDFDLYDRRSLSYLIPALENRGGSTADQEAALYNLNRVIALEADSPNHALAPLLRLKGERLFDMERYRDAIVAFEEALDLGSANYGLLLEAYDHVIETQVLRPEEASDLLARKAKIETLVGSDGVHLSPDPLGGHSGEADGAYDAQPVIHQPIEGDEAPRNGRMDSLGDETMVEYCWAQTEVRAGYDLFTTDPDTTDLFGIPPIEIYDDDIALMSAGANGYVEARLFGYAGYQCGAADGSGDTFEVTALDDARGRDFNVSTDWPLTVVGDVPGDDTIGDTGVEVFFIIEVPAQATDLNVTLTGGTGDADLYVRFGDPRNTALTRDVAVDVSDGVGSSTYITLEVAAVDIDIDCNGTDDDCNGTIDDCDEDLFGFTVTAPSVTGFATVTENCCPSDLPDRNSSYGDFATRQCGPTFDVDRSWTARDDCGNDAAMPDLQQIFVVDTTAPDITCLMAETILWTDDHRPGFDDATAPFACLSKDVMSGASDNLDHVAWENPSNTATNTISGGTSLASPLVAGVAGLVLEEHPTLSPAQVAAELEATGLGSNPLDDVQYELTAVGPATRLDVTGNINFVFHESPGGRQVGADLTDVQIASMKLVSGPQSPASASGPSIQTPDSEVLAGPSTRLLAVGVDSYVSWDFMPLDYAVSDAQRVARAFTDLGYEAELLLEEQATKGRILDELRREALNSRDGDRTVVYFAGHGFSDSMGRPAVVTADGQALALEQIKGVLAAHRGEAIIIVDSCFNEKELPFKRYAIADPKVDPRDATGNVAVFLAGSVGQVALESHMLRGGLYSHTLTEALDRLAEVKHSGAVVQLDFHRLFAEVSAATRELARTMYGTEQNPVTLTPTPGSPVGTGSSAPLFRTGAKTPTTSLPVGLR